MAPGKKIVLGLPKGSLQDATFAMLGKAGFRIATTSRSYVPSVVQTPAGTVPGFSNPCSYVGFGVGAGAALGVGSASAGALASRPRASAAAFLIMCGIIPL